MLRQELLLRLAPLATTSAVTFTHEPVNLWSRLHFSAGQRTQCSTN